MTAFLYRYPFCPGEWSAIESVSSVGAVCKLEWVQGVWDDGVDVSHDKPFKALHGYRLKMSVKTLASWSAHARSTHAPGNPSGPAAL